MATSKAYIGSGKPTKYEGVSVTLRMEEARKHLRTGDDGQQWLTFIVSPKRATDEKGRTHNAFVLIGTMDEPTAQSTVSEPAAGTPVGDTVKTGGRRLRRISKAVAAKLKAAQA